MLVSLKDGQIYVNNAHVKTNSIIAAYESIKKENAIYLKLVTIDNNCIVFVR